VITEEMGAVLWRRYYSARVNAEPHVTMLAENFKDLLEQAGVAEPEDDIVLGPSGSWHGRTMNVERVES
jgi:hypothetical protein